MSHTSSAGPQKLRHWVRELTTFCKRQFGEGRFRRNRTWGFSESV